MIIDPLFYCIVIWTNYHFNHFTQFIESSEFRVEIVDEHLMEPLNKCASTMNHDANSMSKKLANIY